MIIIREELQSRSRYNLAIVFHMCGFVCILYCTSSALLLGRSTRLLPQLHLSSHHSPIKIKMSSG